MWIISKNFSPIGCRDTWTLDLCKKYGIDSYFSGCLTLCFDKCNEKNDNIYIAGEMPDKFDARKYLRINGIFGNVITIPHSFSDKNIMHDFDKRIQIATSYLKEYSHAKLVITNRIHCAMPCRALGTDVVFVNSKYYSDNRFRGLYGILNGIDITSYNRTIFDVEMFMGYPLVPQILFPTAAWKVVRSSMCYFFLFLISIYSGISLFSITHFPFKSIFKLPFKSLFIISFDSYFFFFSRFCFEFESSFLSVSIFNARGVRNPLHCTRSCPVSYNLQLVLYSLIK